MEEHSKLLDMDAGEHEQPTGLRPTRKIAVVSGLCIGLASLIAIVAHAPREAIKTTFLKPLGMNAEENHDSRGFGMRQLLQMWDPGCAHLPMLDFEKVLYSNLGNQGPDHSNGEGYVIQARDMGGGDIERLGRQVLLVINSTGGQYIAANASENRLHGAYGSFNLVAKDELKFKISFYDSKYRKLKMPDVAFTFFDLDAERGMEIKESIEVGGFSHYLVDNTTQLKVTPLPNGNTRFEATERGTFEDNPKNPHHLSLLQRQRAFTLFFKDVEEITGRAFTAEGRHRGHRRFDFVARPTLRCARIEHVGPKEYNKFPPYPVPDLRFKPPLDKPVILHDYPQYFEQWKVKVGDKVKEGDVIATVRVTMKEREIKSPVNGTVKSMQDLQRTDRVDFRLGEMNLAIIEQEILPALETGPKTVKAAVCKKWYFLDHYKVSVGQIIKRNDVVAVTKNELGQHRTEIKAPQGGLISAIQPLKDGQTCQRVEDLNLVTIGKFAPVAPKPLETDCCPGLLGLLGSPVDASIGSNGRGSGDIGSGNLGSTGSGAGGAGNADGAGDGAKPIVFAGWKVAIGDKVKKGDVVATVIREGLVPSGGLLGGDSTSVGPSGSAEKAADKAATDEDDDVGATKRKNVRGADLQAMGGDAEPDTPKEINVTAEAAGFITAMLPLTEGTKIETDKIPIAVVGQKLRILHQSYNEIGHFCTGTFKEWKVQVGDKVEFGQVLVDMEPKPIKANAEGYVTQRQEGLKQGQPIKDVALGDMCIMIAPTLRPLEHAFDEEPVNTFARGREFVEWKKEVGDEVKEGDAIAALKTPEGAILHVSAPRDGVITAVLGGIKPGDDVEKVCSTEATNCTLADIGPKLHPLLLKEKGTNINAPKRVQFLEWKVRKGESVKKGQVLLVCRDDLGKNVTITAPHGGVVVRLLKFLKVGMFLDKVLQTPTVAVISKLGGLGKDPPPGDATVDAPEGHHEIFKDFTVAKGDIVHRGDTVAQVIAIEPKKQAHSGGLLGSISEATEIVENVTAPKDGVVEKLQIGLTAGVPLEDAMQDTQIAIISKPHAPSPEAITQTGVNAPKGCIFKEYLVKEGDFVNPGDPLAIVKLTNGKEYLSDQTIFSHVKGYVVKRAKVVPGEKINDQQIGTTLFVIEGTPWWVTILCILMVLCCLMCCFFLVMKKSIPTGAFRDGASHAAKSDDMLYTEERIQYQHKYRSNKSSRQGCRLDFEDTNGKLHTVWAEYRPIGIKHSQKAPIVVTSFTLNSYAKNALGVKQGWMLVGINEESVRGDTNFNRVGATLEHYISQFPVWALEIEFRETLESEERTIVTFEERPIGIEFFRRSPIQVEHVSYGSPADLKGVKAHWYITRIGDTDVLDNHNFHEVRAMLYEAVKPLNEKEETIHMHRHHLEWRSN